MMNKYNATGHAMKAREEVLGYGFVMTGFGSLTLTGFLYFRSIWLWIPLFFASVMFLIIGFGLLKVQQDATKRIKEEWIWKIIQDWV